MLPSPSQIIDLTLSVPTLTIEAAKEPCPICWDTLTDPRATPCGHIFCNDCIRRAMSHNEDNCPSCRRPLTRKIGIEGDLAEEIIGILKDLPLSVLLKEFWSRLVRMIQVALIATGLLLFTVFVDLYPLILVAHMALLVSYFVQGRNVETLLHVVGLAIAHIVAIIVGIFSDCAKIRRAIVRMGFWQTVCGIVETAVEEATA
jgi:hypothetical protein